MKVKDLVFENQVGKLPDGYVKYMTSLGYTPNEHGFGYGDQNQSTTSQFFIGKHTIVKVTIDTCWKNYAEWLLSLKGSTHAHLPRVYDPSNRDYLSQIGKNHRLQPLNWKGKDVTFNETYFVYAIKMEKLKPINYGGKNGDSKKRYISSLKSVIKNYNDGDKDALKQHAEKLASVFDCFRNSNDAMVFLNDAKLIYDSYNRQFNCRFNIGGSKARDGGIHNVMLRGIVLVLSDPLKSDESWD